MNNIGHHDFESSMMNISELWNEWLVSKLNNYDCSICYNWPQKGNNQFKTINDASILDL